MIHKLTLIKQYNIVISAMFQSWPCWQLSRCTSHCKCRYEMFKPITMILCKSQICPVTFAFLDQTDLLSLQWTSDEVEFVEGDYPWLTLETTHWDLKVDTPDEPWRTDRECSINVCSSVTHCTIAQLQQCKLDLSLGLKSARCKFFIT